MSPEQLLDILAVAGRLKKNLRHCTLMPGRRESVADHSWRLALMAMLLENEGEFAPCDMGKVIRMCLIHDLGEAFTGDIPTFAKSGADDRLEAALYEEWVDSFPTETREQWRGLLSEMEAQATPEARLYKALDKLEAVIAHDEGDTATWRELEYDLQLNHGRKEVAFSPYLTSLKAAVDRLTREKTAGRQKEGE